MTRIGKAVEVDQPFNDRLSDDVLNQIRPDKTRPAGDQQVHKVFGMYRTSMTVQFVGFLFSGFQWVSAYSSASVTGRSGMPVARSFETSRTQFERGVLAPKR